MVGLLSIGVVGSGDERSVAGRESRLLASAIDYASVLGAVAGPAIAGRRIAAATRARLDRELDQRAFHAVFQPIVDLESLATVGYEALTRFDEGTRPESGSPRRRGPASARSSSSRR